MDLVYCITYIVLPIVTVIILLINQQRKSSKVLTTDDNFISGVSTKVADAIGIDLGTTFSTIACYRNGRAEIIPDQQGNRLVPSIVYVDPQTGKMSVGNIAYDLSTKSPENLLRDAKRIIGRKFDDESITKWNNSQQRMYSLVRDENDKAAFEVTVLGKNVIKTPEEVSAEILKYLKKMAEDYLDKKISEAVISIPAYFSNGQRKATKRAAELAGLKVIKLITEPVAAALHYVKDRNLFSTLMVLDWGGGTLDISFIKANQSKLEVEAVYGDTLLGGRNIDKNLLKHFFVPVKKQPVKFMRRLLEKCISLKEHLSTNECFNVSIDCYDGENDLSLNLDRKKFEEINEDIFERAIDIVKYGLNDLGYKTSKIDIVVLVGGTTRTPKIKELLNSEFGKNKIKTDLNPDEAVAAGACIQAAVLKHESKDLEKFNISEVTPLSLGVECSGNLFTVLIKRNSKLPLSVTSNFDTYYNNQSNMVIAIYEGERSNNKYNNKLAQFKLDGLPLKRAGDVTVLITFSLDEDGILTVTASEKSTGKTNHLTLTMSEFYLSESKIKFKINEAKAMKYEDDVFEEFVRFRYKLIKKCNHILFEVDKISSVTNRQNVKDKCKQFISFAELLDFTEKDKLQDEFNSLRNSVFSILGKCRILEICDK